MVFTSEPLVDLVFTCHRPPDWRWQVAQLLSIADLEFEPGDIDEDTLALRDYLRDLLAGREPEPIEGLAEARAIALTDPRERVALEGYIMAGCTPDAIAAKTGLPAQTIHWFERAFFAAREWRQYPDWVVSFLFNDAGPNAGFVRSICIELRKVAYRYGLANFEQALAIVFQGSAYARDAAWADKAEGIGEPRRRHFRRALLVQLLVTSGGMMEVEERLNARILRIWKREKRTVKDEERQELSCLEYDRILKQQHGIDMETYAFFPEAPATQRIQASPILPAGQPCAG